MTTAAAELPAAPLTVLSEEEQMFQQSVRDFAVEKIRPLVNQMDHDAQMSNDLIDDQKAKYLSRRAKDTVGAYALSEAGSGSDAFALACRAEDKGDHWVLNGQKLWITNAYEAGFFIVFANANPDAGYKGITAFLIERDFPGFTVGKKEDKLGIRASSTCELILEDCHVPKENVLGEPGKGYKIAIETLNEGRIGIGAQMIGVARGALEHAISYVKERRQFGQP